MKQAIALNKNNSEGKDNKRTGEKRGEKRDKTTKRLKLGDGRAFINHRMICYVGRNTEILPNRAFMVKEAQPRFAEWTVPRNGNVRVHGEY